MPFVRTPLSSHNNICFPFDRHSGLSHQHQQQQAKKMLQPTSDLKKQKFSQRPQLLDSSEELENCTTCEQVSTSTEVQQLSIFRSRPVVIADQELEEMWIIQQATPICGDDDEDDLQISPSSSSSGGPVSLSWGDHLGENQDLTMFSSSSILP